jgi:hypothetical protein
VLDHSDPKMQERYVDPTICPTEQSSVDCLPPLDLKPRQDLPPAGNGDRPAA